MLDLDLLRQPGMNSWLHIFVRLVMMSLEVFLQHGGKEEITGARSDFIEGAVKCYQTSWHLPSALFHFLWQHIWDPSHTHFSIPKHFMGNVMNSISWVEIQKHYGNIFLLDIAIDANQFILDDVYPWLYSVVCCEHGYAGSLCLDCHLLQSFSTTWQYWHPHRCRSFTLVLRWVWIDWSIVLTHIRM